MGLTSIFRIDFNSNDITEYINTHLESIEFRDKVGVSSDEITIKVLGQFQRPVYRDEIKLWLGWKEIGLSLCGLFVVQTVERENDNIMTITATGVDFSASLKEKRNHAYEECTLSGLCSIIAKRHGLQVKADYDEIHIQHRAQTNESDVHLLKRLAEEYHATFSIKNSTLIFLHQSPEKRDKLPVAQIHKDDQTSINIKYSDKTIYKSCRAVWHDTKENTTKETVVGSGAPELRYERKFKDEADARQRAERKLSLANQGAASGEIESPGVMIYAGSRLNLTGTLEDDGEYLTTSVTHTVTPNDGWMTSIEFEA